MGHPAFPFIGQGKDPMYEREREKNRGKRKIEEEIALGLCHPPPPVGVSCCSHR
jgi:hypothetical protein